MPVTQISSGHVANPLRAHSKCHLPGTAPQGCCLWVLCAPPASPVLLSQPAANPHSWREGSFQMVPWKSAGVSQSKGVSALHWSTGWVRAVNPAAGQSQIRASPGFPKAPRDRAEPARAQCYSGAKGKVRAAAPMLCLKFSFVMEEPGHFENN